ncbi:unnamed protein product [Dovyalis caffra]|uniref:4-coumarate--CoA ligase n=1 Tax=Dovyalis caffra TaxID=77055 RepID=A0AAV1QNX5_9ROSI|nr:unnamed protein product [Dovyalis caffra]
MDQANSPINPKNGFNSITKTFHSLRPPIHLPPEETPFSAAEYALSLHASYSSWPDSVAIIDSSTGQKLSCSDFSKRTKSLTLYLQNVIQLSKNDTAFVLCPNYIKVPILYFSLLSLGVVISPANPMSTESELSHQINLSNPVIAFATSETCHKLPKLKHRTIHLDSPEFDSIITMFPAAASHQELGKVKVNQSDLAAIMYSSGTAGKVKGVMLTHRNLMAVIAGYYPFKQERKSPTVMLYTVPYFSPVVMERFDMKKMLRAVEEFGVTELAVAPPVVVAMARSALTDGYDLRSLETVALRLVFNGVMQESRRWGSVGRITAGCEAKIVDPDTSYALPPGKRGELWIRGSTIMKGYVGDPGATSTTLESDGWLRTGDLCYIDEEGFVFVVDRLKGLIKYKGYQVAPAELEQLLQSHPEIADAAVIPYPDEEAGQVPMALVVKRSQSRINERSVIDFVAKQVAPFKKVRRVAFISSIPKSAAGKIVRKELRKMVQIPLPSSKM